MPAKTPPACAVKGSEPFMPPKPADRPMMATDQACVKAQHDRPRPLQTHQLANQLSTDQTPDALPQFPDLSGLHITQDTGMDLDSDSDIDPVN